MSKRARSLKLDGGVWDISNIDRARGSGPSGRVRDSGLVLGNTDREVAELYSTSGRGNSFICAGNLRSDDRKDDGLETIDGHVNVRSGCMELDVR